MRFCLWLSTPRIYKLFRDFAKLVSKSALIYPIRICRTKNWNYAKRKHPTNDLDIEIHAIPFDSNHDNCSRGNFWCLPTHGLGLGKTKRKERICDVQRVGQEWEGKNSTKWTRGNPSTHTLNSNSYERKTEVNTTTCTSQKIEIKVFRQTFSSLSNFAALHAQRNVYAYVLVHLQTPPTVQATSCGELLHTTFFILSYSGFEVVPGGSRFSQHKKQSKRKSFRMKLMKTTNELAIGQSNKFVKQKFTSTFWSTKYVPNYFHCAGKHKPQRIMLEVSRVYMHSKNAARDHGFWTPDKKQTKTFFFSQCRTRTKAPTVIYTAVV